MSVRARHRRRIARLTSTIHFTSIPVYGAAMLSADHSRLGLSGALFTIAVLLTAWAVGLDSRS